MKKQEAKKQIRSKVVLFWVGFLVITGLFIGLTLSLAFSRIEFKSMNDVDKANLIIYDLTNPDEDTYYVYIYSAKSDKNLEKKQEIETSILNYFSFVRANKGKDGIVKIYAFNVDTYASIGEYSGVYGYLGSFSSDIKQANVPMLIKMSGDSVSNTYTTTNNIQKELQSAMKNK